MIFEKFRFATASRSSWIAFIADTKFQSCYLPSKQNCRYSFLPLSHKTLTRHQYANWPIAGVGPRVRLGKGGETHKDLLEVKSRTDFSIRHGSTLKSSCSSSQCLGQGTLSDGIYTPSNGTDGEQVRKFPFFKFSFLTQTMHWRVEGTIGKQINKYFSDDGYNRTVSKALCELYYTHTSKCAYRVYIPSLSVPCLEVLWIYKDVLLCACVGSLHVSGPGEGWRGWEGKVWESAHTQAQSLPPPPPPSTVYNPRLWIYLPHGPAEIKLWFSAGAFSRLGSLNWFNALVKWRRSIFIHGVIILLDPHSGAAKKTLSRGLCPWSQMLAFLMWNTKF